MQPPTCVGLRIRTPKEALIICHAVNMRMLRMVNRRLDTDERRAITSGNVYVWEERGPSSEGSGMGIERWTDSISWGPSRVRDEFLYYQERRPVQPEYDSISNPGSIHVRQPPYRQSLIKQTYSVYVTTSEGSKKWHIIAYFTQDTLESLETIDDRPALATLIVPPGMYRCARTSKVKHSRISSYRHDSYQYPYTSQRVDIPRGPPSPMSSDTQPSEDGHNEVRSQRMRPSPSHCLPPLEYLQRRPPPNRHALDESAIMSFACTLPETRMRQPMSV